ncbi:MAG: 4Fe-4S dicluster domain-containing protein [Actinomycetia bacterium]|nr:4Fe-4S dicluster domain-containing protein [Actinomycetes bacterium]MCP4962030.1 4Fe-4S dicluster domain-containing protein [Actinomycetes bacterium]
MSHKVLDSACIGCGGCDYACPTGALYKTDSFLGLFEIDPYRCDDCLDCIPLCPEIAIVPDPEWVVCHGRGCPLSSERLKMVQCNVFQAQCPTCEGPLWKAEGDDWTCPRCDDGRKVGCPKVRMFEKYPVPEPLHQH